MVLVRAEGVKLWRSLCGRVKMSQPMRALLRPLLLASLCCLLPGFAASAQFGFTTPTGTAQQATVSAALNLSALQPGQDAVVAVVLDVKRGFHAQSAQANK